MPFLDDGLNQAIGETIAGEFDMLLRGRTYEIFAAYWLNQVDNPIAKALNKATKYASRAAWTVLPGRNHSVLTATLLRRSASLRHRTGRRCISGQQQNAADAARRRTHPRVSHLGISRTACRRVASLWSRREARLEVLLVNTYHAAGRLPRR